MPDNGQMPEDPGLLTVEDIRRLKQVAQREEIREAHRRKFDAVVHKTDMTPEEAKLSGALKSVRSCSLAHERALAALAKAQREVDRTAGELKEVRVIYMMVRDELLLEKDE